MQDSPGDTPLPPAIEQPKSSGLAWTSIVLGVLPLPSWGVAVLFLGLVGPRLPDWLPAIIVYLAFCLPGLLAAVLAIILGHAARNRARQAPERYGGARLARAGIVLGYVGILGTMFLVAMTIPGLQRARVTDIPLACINNLKQIDGAKAQWALENHKRPGDPVVDDEVNAYLRHSARPVCPRGGVYRYNAVGVNPTCSRGPDMGHTL
jgi:hypothetical protein